MIFYSPWHFFETRRERLSVGTDGAPAAGPSDGGFAGRPGLGDLVDGAFRVAQGGGLDAAVTWIWSRPEVVPGERDRVAGVFYMRKGRLRPAVAHLVRGIDRLCTSRRIWFDVEGRFILYIPTSPEKRDDLAILLADLRDAAIGCLCIDETEQALRLATMGVSTGEHLRETGARALGPDGSRTEGASQREIDCHLVRAFVFLQRGDEGAARAAISSAESLAGEGEEAGWVASIREALPPGFTRPRGSRGRP